MDNRQVGPLVRGALVLDAIASAGLGLLLLAAFSVLAGPLGAPRGLLVGAGLVLVPWGALVWWVARARPHRAAVAGVVGFNASWVAASVVVVVTDWVAWTGWGVALVVGQAVAVAGLTAVQATGLRVKPAVVAA